MVVPQQVVQVAPQLHQEVLCRCILDQALWVVSQQVVQVGLLCPLAQHILGHRVRIRRQMAFELVVPQVPEDP
jgi:hypothetical protein